MKYVKVPQPIEIAKGAAADPEKKLAARPPLMWSISDGVSFVVDNSPAYAKPASMQRAGARLVRAFERAAELGAAFAELKDEDWAQLKEVIEASETPWGSWHAVQADGSVVQMPVPPRRFLPFSDAIAEALGDESFSKLNAPAPAASAVANGAGAAQ